MSPIPTLDAFWIVWNPEGRNPQVRHDERCKAVREAERLARECPGKSFIVMQACEMVRVDSLQRTRYLRDELIKQWQASREKATKNG